MIRFAALLFVSVLSTQAFASGSSVHRYASRVLTCSQAKRAVNMNGAVILYYGDSLFHRVVSHQGFCGTGELIKWFQAPTRDDADCDVGYVCETMSYGGEGGNQ